MHAFPPGSASTALTAEARAALVNAALSQIRRWALTAPLGSGDIATLMLRISRLLGHPLLWDAREQGLLDYQELMQVGGVAALHSEPAAGSAQAERKLLMQGRQRMDWEVGDVHGRPNAVHGSMP